MNKTHHNRARTGVALGGSILAAAWLINGSEFLSIRGITGVANELLVWVPAMLMMLWLFAGDQQTRECERRAFGRLLGK